MNMNHLAVAAAVLATCLGTAHARTELRDLAPGTYRIDFPADGTPELSEEFYISLHQSSLVTGTFIGVASLDLMQASTFSEMEGSTSIDAQVRIEQRLPVSLAHFDFGVLTKTAMPPGMVGIPDPDGYTVRFTGMTDPSVFRAGSAVALTLKVSAVPELSSWAMMALGLGGLVAVQRRRRA